MSDRTFSILIGAGLFGTLVPIVYPILFDAPVEGTKGIILLAAAGMAFGTLLGILFPRFFLFGLEYFTDL